MSDHLIKVKQSGEPDLDNTSGGKINSSKSELNSSSVFSGSEKSYKEFSTKKSKTKINQIFHKYNWLPVIPIAAVLVIWQILSTSGIIPPFMLPSPLRVITVFIADFPLLMRHLSFTLMEAMTGLAIAVTAAFVLAVFMDANRLIKQSLTPILLLTQTLPVIAIAPLLILWMGYGLAPKIMLVFLTCFFPVTIGLLGAFASADNDALRLLQSMGAKKWQLYWYIKIPQGLPAFFSGLKIAASYSIIGAVVAEWLGGDAGLGVYMIRVRRTYSFDRMFAVIILISVLSLLLIKLVSLLEKKVMPWRYRK